MKELESYPNEVAPKPEHGASGTHREFTGHWAGTDYSGDRLGCDIYCANCDHWSTVKGKNILYSIVGDCKNCGTSFIKERYKP